MLSAESGPFHSVGGSDAPADALRSSMAAATLETCYHRVGDGEAAPRRRRRVRICALLGATALGWCLLTTAQKAVDTSKEDDLSTQPQEPQEHALREVRAVRGWLNHTLTVEAGVWHLPQGISFHTRLYNGAAPSPVLCCADTYVLEPPYSTYVRRAMRTGLLHAVRTDCSGQLAPRRHALYGRRTPCHHRCSGRRRVTAYG